MNKKKSQEYLDKINQAFRELNDPANDIDLDSLLGYIRIFYSSVKGIPTIKSPAEQIHVSSTLESISSTEESIEVVDEPNREEATHLMNQDIHSQSIANPLSDSNIEEKDALINEEEKVAKIDELAKVNEDEEKEDEEGEHDEAHDIKSEVKNLKDEEVKDEDFKEEYIQKDAAVADPIVNSESTTEDVNTYEKIISAHTTSNLDEKIEELPEIISVIPKAEQEEIEAHQNNVAEVVNMQEAEIKVPDTKPFEEEIKLELPDIHNSSKFGTKGSILSQIETDQPKTLYTPTNHESHNPSDAVESLFKEKSPTGLVDFLGLSPLDNINKAWGLNEKMLVIKDLFGDDFNAFNETIEMINKLTSFAEVKNYLIGNVVYKYSWNDISKFKKASDFIVQTKRLFVK